MKKKITVTIISFFLALIDLLFKYYLTQKTFFEGSFIYLTYSQNPGSAFSVFADIEFYSYIIFTFSILAIFLIYYYFDYINRSKYIQTAIILAVAGIASNAYDRIVFGYVRDYIAIENLFIFNLADVFIITAFILYLLHEIKEIKKSKLSKH